MTITVLEGDMLEVLPKLVADGTRYHCCVTDPPYHLSSITKRFGKEGSAPVKVSEFYTANGESKGSSPYVRSSAGFMGKQWDGGDIAFRPETWRAVYDVLLPGGWLVALGGSRTFHRLACAIEDAGFEIRDSLCWLYGAGFPKSRNVSKELCGLPWCSCPGPRPVGADVGTESVARQADGITTNDAGLLDLQSGGRSGHRQTTMSGGVEDVIGERDPEVFGALNMTGFAKRKSVVHPICSFQAEPEALGDQMMSNQTLSGPTVSAMSVSRDDSRGDNTPSPTFVGPTSASPSGIPIASKSRCVVISHANSGTVSVDSSPIIVEPNVACPTDSRLWTSLERATGSAGADATVIDTLAYPSTETDNISTCEKVGSADFAGFGKHADTIQELVNDRKVLVCLSCGKPQRPEWVIDGTGTALKPAMELICLARRPLSGTNSENYLKHGCGALNIDASRVGTTDQLDGGRVSTKTDGWDRPWKHDADAITACRQRIGENVAKAEALGRYPANVIHDGSDEVLAAFEAFGEHRSPEPYVRASGSSSKAVYGEYASRDGQINASFGDSGSAARFFYSAKADAADRADSKHPTIKPVDLIRYLVRLVTPPNGKILDPFAGSGTTAEAAMLLGFDCTLVEKDAQHANDIRHRIKRWSGGDMPLFAQ